MCPLRISPSLRHLDPILHKVFLAVYLQLESLNWTKVTGAFCLPEKVKEEK